MPGVRLELRELTHSYGERTVLRRLALEVAPGEFLAVVGCSGPGKTTLLRTLAGSDLPGGATVVQDGRSSGSTLGRA